MKIFITVFFMICVYPSFSQTNVSVELFGANGLGFSVNGNFHIPVTENQKVSFIAGLGLNIQGEPKYYWLYKMGAYYTIGKWGIGTDMAVLNRFGDASLTAYQEEDLIFYPNVNYYWNLKNGNHFKLSGGVGIGRERVINPEFNPDLSHEMSWRYYPSIGLVYSWIKG